MRKRICNLILIISMTEYRFKGRLIQKKSNVPKVWQQQIMTPQWLSMLSIYRFHNGTLLDRNQYQYDETLILRNLTLDHMGEYYCRASHENGAIKSKPATLTVTGLSLSMHIFSNPTFRFSSHMLFLFVQDKTSHHATLHLIRT